MSTTCVYSYANAAGETVYVDNNDYNYTGTWSSSGTYFSAALDVALYATTQYIAILNNVGDNPRRTPTRTRPASWSVLSLLYEYQCSGTNTDLAGAAYTLAAAGTNAAAAAQATADTAFALAASGTAAAASALSVATAAFDIAVMGTDAAAVAYSVADAAYGIAVIGTNAAGSAGSRAEDAYTLATVGTNAAAAAQFSADVALQTAWAGTALALQTAWVGTTPGISGTVYAAFQFNGPTDTQLIFTNGILTAWNYPM